MVVSYVGEFGSVCCHEEGVGRKGFMGGGSFWGCQRLHSKIRRGFHLGGCLRQILRGYENIQECLGGIIFMAMHYFHDIAHGAKWVSFFMKVFHETGRVAIGSEGFFMFFKSLGEASSSLSDVRLIRVGTG